MRRIFVTSKDKTLVIDGSYGEGGGQILRTSLSLAAITGRSVRIENIRAGRTKPGLQPQHLTSARATAKICGGRLTGDAVGSQLLEFHPGDVQPGDYVFDVSEIKASAGAVNLIFQTVLLPLALSGKRSKVTIRGGTHVPMSPNSNYVDDVYLPVLARMGLLVHYRMKKAGYYPIGGGEIEAEILPVDSLRPVKFTERGEGTVLITSAVSNLPMSIAERQAKSAAARLREDRVWSAEDLVDYPSPGKGTVAFVHFNGGDLKAGFTSLGALGKPAEKVGREAGQEFCAWHASGAAVDKHLADQLIVPAALADGESVYTTEEVTEHLRTNIWTVEHFLDVRIKLEGNTVRITGG